MAYRSRAEVPAATQACVAARRKLLESHLGDLSLASRASAPVEWAQSGASIEIQEMPASDALGVDRRVVFSTGLSDPAIDAGAGRCGLGYELFMLVPAAYRSWAVDAVRALCGRELSSGVDLYRRVSEESCVTIERFAARSPNPQMSSLLCFAPWQAESTPHGSVLLIVATLIHDDELQWALRYKPTQLFSVLEKSGHALVSDPERRSCLDEPALARVLAEAQMQGWYERLEDSGVAGYFLDEVQQRLDGSWTSIALRVLRSGAARLTVETSPQPLRCDWTPGSAPPALMGRPMRDFPSAIAALVNLMGIVAAAPGSLEAGEWEHVEMRIAPGDAGQFKLDWDFGYSDRS